MSNLIGLHGKKQSGKDTAFATLEAHVGLNDALRVKRDAFADRLKLSAMRNFIPNIGLDMAYKACDYLKRDNAEVTMQFESESGVEVYSVTGREFLQFYGTEAHREVFDYDFWVTQVLPDLTDYDSFGRPDGDDWDVLVVTDVRFPNEAEAIRAAGGVIWEIVRPSLDDGGDSHASEAPLPRDLVDVTIINDGGLDEFRDKVVNQWYIDNCTVSTR